MSSARPFVGEYFDTYFRLLREDCVSAIRQSIANVRDGGERLRSQVEAVVNVLKAGLKGFTVGKGPDFVLKSVEVSSHQCGSIGLGNRL